MRRIILPLAIGLVGCSTGDTAGPGPQVEYGLPVKSITIEGPASLTVSGSAFVRAVVVNTANRRVTGNVLTWASSDTTVLTVDHTGLARGLREGSATVTASLGLVRGEGRIVVDPCYHHPWDSC